MAVALAVGRLTPAEFDQHNLADPSVRRLIAATELVFDPSLSDGNPKSFCAAARVDLVLHSGRGLNKTVHFMRGHPKNPMTLAEFEDKFTMCVKSSLDRASIRTCLSMINEFEKLPEIGPLLALLSVPGRP